MKKKLLFILFLIIAVKGFSQWSPFYICDDCSTAVEGGSTVMINPGNINSGAYLQLNSILPLSTGVLNLKTASQYSYFFTKLESNSIYDDATTFNLNKLGLLLNFDFIL